MFELKRQNFISFAAFLKPPACQRKKRNKMQKHMGKRKTIMQQCHFTTATLFFQHSQLTVLKSPRSHRNLLL